LKRVEGLLPTKKILEKNELYIMFAVTYMGFHEQMDKNF